MRCDNQLFLGDLTMVGDCLVRHQLDDLGMLVYPQILSNAVKKFQRMKLRLIFDAHRTRNLERKFASI